MRVSPSPALTESFPTVWSLLSPSPPLRLMPRLTQRLTHGCIITVLAMLLILMVTVIMVITWVTVWVILGITAIIWVMLGIMDIIWATMERGVPRLSQLPRLMPKLPQRLTPGCTTAMLDTDSTHTVMGIMVMVWVMLPMLDITRTHTTVAAEMATEPWFPVLPGNSVEVSA